MFYKTIDGLHGIQFTNITQKIHTNLKLNQTFLDQEDIATESNHLEKIFKSSNNKLYNSN